MLPENTVEIYGIVICSNSFRMVFLYVCLDSGLEVRNIDLIFDTQILFISFFFFSFIILNIAKKILFSVNFMFVKSLYKTQLSGDKK